jgi:alanine-synthesizing transaminase
MQALLNSGDEMLVPAPDYPLWTAAVALSSGKAVHYLCDESSDWFPDLDDIPRENHPTRTRGHRDYQPEQPDRRGLLKRAAAGDRRDRSPA